METVLKILVVLIILPAAIKSTRNIQRLLKKEKDMYLNHTKYKDHDHP